MSEMNLWNQILERIETKVNRHCFNSWFKPTLFFGQQGNTLSVAVPNGLFKASSAKPWLRLEPRILRLSSSRIRVPT
jgi:chromosomal replication initiation ATPase DnaA